MLDDIVLYTLLNIYFTQKYALTLLSLSSNLLAIPNLLCYILNTKSISTIERFKVRCRHNGKLVKLHLKRIVYLLPKNIKVWKQ